MWTSSSALNFKLIADRWATSENFKWNSPESYASVDEIATGRKENESQALSCGQNSRGEVKSFTNLKLDLLKLHGVQGSLLRLSWGNLKELANFPIAFKHASCIANDNESFSTTWLLSIGRYSSDASGNFVYEDFVQRRISSSQFLTTTWWLKTENESHRNLLECFAVLAQNFNSLPEDCGGSRFLLCRHFECVESHA